MKFKNRQTGDRNENAGSPSEEGALTGHGSMMKGLLGRSSTVWSGGQFWGCKHQEQIHQAGHEFLWFVSPALI